jgi:hypothetical protein
MVQGKTLGELIQECIDKGVTHFELFDISTDFPDEDWDTEWHWDIYDQNHHKYHRISIHYWPDVIWLGNENGTHGLDQRNNPNRWLKNKWFKGFPFMVHWYAWDIRWLTYKKMYKQGCQGGKEETLEDGLQAALITYQCESNGKDCTVEECEFHSACKLEDQQCV